ncbi:MAG: cytochrome c biogenesis protein ResB [Candidatus Bipolaricaulis sp.]|nr:cytochrome c biogenesis protein ResB [Candidatus Bipolaricaulis sp.]
MVGRALLRRLVGHASSTRTAVVLILLIAVSCTIGALVPQSPTTPNADALYRSYGPVWGALIRALRLNDVFGSSWFVALVSLLAVSLGLCTARTLVRHIRALFTLPVSPLPSGSSSGCTPVPAATGEQAWMKQKARRCLEARGYRVRAAGEQLVAERRRWSRLAPDLVHVSLLLILVGALLSIYREEGSITVREAQRGLVLSIGTSAAGGVHPETAHFAVRADDFGAQGYPETGLYRDYWTNLTVFDSNGQEKSARIRVNHPLVFRGYSFHLTGYGDDLGAAEVSIAVVERPTNTVVGAVALRSGETRPVGHGGPKIGLTRFFTNFRIAQDGTPVDLPGSEALNPAAILDVFTSTGGEGSTYRTVAFIDPPDPHWSGDEPFAFYIERFSVPKFVQLGYTRDPGYPLVWVGFVLMMTGLAGSFYLRPRRVWVIPEPENRRVLICQEVGRGGVEHGAGSWRVTRALARELGGGASVDPESGRPV